MTHRAKVAGIVIVLTAPCLVLCFPLLRKAVVAYHCRGVTSSWEAIDTLGRQDQNVGDHIEAFEYHRNELVRLGFLEHRQFMLKNIPPRSLRRRRMWQELSAHVDVLSCGYCTMNAGTDDPVVVDVWDVPEKISRLEEIVRAHDSADSTAVPEDPRALERFEGTWADEDGNVNYTISANAGRTAAITTPENSTWTTVIRNARVDGNRLMFDQYSYTPASEALKSIVTPSGDHPYSGMRNEITLETSPADADRMALTTTNFQLTAPLVTNLHRMGKNAP